MTDVFAPQSSVDSRKFVQSFNDDGSANFAQVGADQLNYQALFGQGTTSTSENAISGGNKTFTLDDDTGSIQIDYTVQILSLDDTTCWMYGVVTAKNTTVSPAQIEVAVFRTSPNTLLGENWFIQVVAGPFQGLPASQALGISTDSFAVPTYGDTLSLTTDTGKAFAAGDTVYVASIIDSTAYAIGTVFTYNTATGAISIFVRRFGGSGTQAIWSISLIDTAGADAALIGFSTSSIAIGAGTFTFTIQTSKFMPINGSVFITALADPTKHLWASVKAYSSTSLVVTVAASGVFGSGTFSAWSLYLVDGAPAGIPLYQLNGLRVTINASDPAHDIDISAGSVRDSTNTVDLVLPTGMTKQLDALWAAGTNQGAQQQSAALAGTVTVSGANVTGTGTAFLTDFGSTLAATLTDFVNQGGTWSTNSAQTNGASVIAVTGASPSVSGLLAVPSNTAATASSGVIVGASYKRGGTVTPASNPINYGIVLVRKDTDGSVDIISSALTGSGQPDLPNGYTSYRVIASVAWTGGAFYTIFPIQQPLAFSTNRVNTVASGSFGAVTNVTVAIPAGYSDIEISWSGLSFDTATRALLIQLSVDGGLTYDATAANYNIVNLNATGGVVAASSIASIIGAATQTAAQTANGSVVLSGYATAGFKTFQGTNLSSAPALNGTLGTYVGSMAVITNIKFLLNGTGNFDAGTYSVSVK